MIEVVFGECEYDSMVFAKEKQMIVDEGISDILCFAFGMDIGDISSFCEDLEAVRKLKYYAKNGESIRIWYSDAPYSCCGFYHVCYMLEKYNSSVSVIKLPHIIRGKNQTIRLFNSWSEICYEELGQFLLLEESLVTTEVNYYASKWKELREENSELRAVVNGRLISVPIDFYDHLIRKEIPKKEFKVARLVGEIISKYQIRVSDAWFEDRIVHMIKQGELAVIQSNEHFYEQVLKIKEVDDESKNISGG